MFIFLNYTDDRDKKAQYSYWAQLNESIGWLFVNYAMLRFIKSRGRKPSAYKATK